MVTRSALPDEHRSSELVRLEEVFRTNYDVYGLTEQGRDLVYSRYSIIRSIRMRLHPTDMGKTLYTKEDYDKQLGVAYAGLNESESNALHSLIKEMEGFASGLTWR